MFHYVYIGKAALELGGRIYKRGDVADAKHVDSILSGHLTPKFIKRRDPDYVPQAAASAPASAPAKSDELAKA